MAEYRPPAYVQPIEKGRKMADMVVSGELAGAIGVEINAPNVKPLIPLAAQAGLDALRTRGHYPINHLIVVRDDVLRAQPQLAPALFEAFAESKRRYVARLRAGSIDPPTPVDALHRSVMAVTGADPLPYGIDANRQALQDALAAAVEQGIVDRAPTLEELFPHNTHQLSA